MSRNSISSSRRQFLKSLAAGAAAAQAAPLLRASVVRSLVDGSGAAGSAMRLDSGWEYCQGPLDGPWEVWQRAVASWEKVALPHCFNSCDGCDPDRPYYRGQGWYRTKVKVANPMASGRTLLHFEGTGQTSRVYVGGTLLGRHVGGYDEYVYDLTDAVAQPGSRDKDGAVALAVMCDNSPEVERPPSDLSDFCLYGGLYRNVHLVYVPAVSLEAVHIAPSWTPGAADAGVKIKARLYNPQNFAGKVKVVVEAADAEGKSSFRAEKTLAAWKGEAEIASFRIPSPRLWGPAHPHLYTCTVTLTSEHGRSEAKERFGIRHAEFVEDGPFRLNGERLLIRGTQRHMDHAGYAAAQPDELVRTEMRLMKEMGANFVRLAHYQQTRLVLNLCDELGLMVWEEAPWCRSGIGSEAWQKNTLGMLEHMIDQHFNHPSVILWSLGNEDDWPGEYPSMDREAICGFMQRMNDKAHELDPSRVTGCRRCDFARHIPDVYSPSIWAGWYGGVYTEYAKSLEEQRARVKRLVHMEWGADSHAGRHAENPYEGLGKIAKDARTDEFGLAYLPSGGDARVSRDGDWSETYACDLFDWYLKTQETLPWFAGSAQWIFKDFPTPLRVENPVPRMNQKGVLERDMTLKEGYYVFQSYWAEKPMAHIYGHSWPVRWGGEGEERVVKVYSNCATAELFLNGKSLGTKKRNCQDFPAAGLRWMAVFAPGENHLRVVAAKDGVMMEDEIEFEYQTTKWGASATLKLAEIARDAKTATVEATLHDTSGVLCLDARDVVRFSLAGEGRLIDNLGTASGSRVVQLGNGRARISIERGAGAATVGVAGEGLAPAFVTIEA
ncbi:MAG TPA: glycoside hydrolase family 2 TIM barrel-domain containing protein [Terracidiphilus sp.]|nr:glycoside hydrolase family 2 TIM barrel-domain containing protein [Terracidiphilus sp.]